MIAVRLNRPEFVATMRSITDRATRPRAIMAAVGREIGNQLRQHFRKKDRNEPNKFGARRSHFWLQMGRSVSAPMLPNDSTVRVEITDPRFAQKVFGGKIEAQRTKNLAIPASAEAYDRAPAVFEQETGLKLFFVKKRLRSRLDKALATREPGRPFATIHYILKERVYQPADLEALPPEDQLERAITHRAQATLNRQLNPGGTA